jgi:hypothetical protein
MQVCACVAVHLLLRASLRSNLAVGMYRGQLPWQNCQADGVCCACFVLGWAGVEPEFATKLAVFEVDDGGCASVCMAVMH